MRALFAVALLCSSVALAQSETPGSSGSVQGNFQVSGTSHFDGGVTIQVASGSNALDVSAVNGARVKIGSGALAYVDSDGTNVRFGGSVNMGAGALTVGQNVASPSFTLSNTAATASNSTSTNPWTFDDAQGVAQLGVATASLTACNSTAPNVSGGMRGSEQYDTTKNAYSYCNGTRYVDVRGALRTTTSIDFGLIAAGSNATSADIAMPGVVDGQICTVGATTPAYVTGVSFFCLVASAGNVHVRAVCNNGTTCDPNPATYTIDVAQ